MAATKRDKRKARKVSLHPTSSPVATKVSLLPQYAPAGGKGRRRERKAAEVIPVAIEDPWPEHAPAFLREPPKRAQSRNGEAAEWITPEKPKIEVLASRRDVIAGMHRRGWMDDAMFYAARDYQRTFETALALPIKTIDPSRPVVSGGTGRAAEVVDAVREAAVRMARIERGISRRYGAEAVAFCRDVLGQGLTIERAAHRRGDGDKERVRWWGTTMRKCLETIAEGAGYAVHGAYKNRRRQDKRREDERERQERRLKERQEQQRKQRGKR